MAAVGVAALIAGGGWTSRTENAARSASVLPVPSSRAPHALGWDEPDPTTTTTSTLPAPEPKRMATGGKVPAVQPSSPVDDAFWRRLANCESPHGASGQFAGYFQFSGDTAKKAGYHGGSYEEQLAAAKRWLAIIGVAKAGTRAGWPICWWVALRGA